MGRAIHSANSLPGGKGKSGSVFPEKTHTHHYKDVKGAGAMGDYSDTEDKIHRDQEAGVNKMQGRKLKPGYRY